MTFRVFSEDSQDGTPAGEYRSLDRAIEHAETVTYPMIVVDDNGVRLYSNQPAERLGDPDELAAQAAAKVVHEM